METLIAELQLAPMIGTVIYSVLGILILFLAFIVFEKMTPFSVRKEIEEDQNVALGIILGASILGIAIIIAAVIRS